MTGRRLFWILLVLTGAMLVAQVRQARDLWRANLILSAVETITMQQSQSGRAMPRQMGEAHLRLLRNVLELNPALVDTHVASSWQYLLLGNPRGAIRVLDKALALEPRGRVHANLGEAYLKDNRLDEAREAFETALVLDPQLRQELQSQLRQIRRQP